jgi:carbamoyltransferase
MLCAAEVRGDTLPAITRVDGSSHIQAVNESGGVRKNLKRFDYKTYISALMNTSFNGPGEPISEIKVIYIEGRQVTLTYFCFLNRSRFH